MSYSSTGPDEAERDERPRRKKPRPERRREARALLQLTKEAGLDPQGREARHLKKLAMLGELKAVEPFLQILEQRAQKRILNCRSFPIITNATSGEIHFGTSTDLGEDGEEIRCDVSGHIGVFGKTRTGKSHFVKSLTVQRIRAGRRVWIFDSQVEHGGLLDLFHRFQLWLLGIATVRLNPLEAHGDPIAWIGIITNLLRSLYYLRDGAAALLSQVLGQLYAERGCLRGSDNWPTMWTLWSTLQTMKFAQTSRSAGSLESLSRAVKSILDVFGTTFSATVGMPIKMLVKESIVWDTSQLQSIDAEFFISLLLAQIGTDASGEVLDLTIALEEAHEFLNKARQSRQDLGEPPLESAFRMAAKKGVQLCVCDQAPGLLPESVLANLQSYCVFRLTNTRCADAIAPAIGLDREQKVALPMLPLRHAIVRTDSLGQAVLVRMRHEEFPKKAPAEIDAEMAAELDAVPWTPCEAGTALSWTGASPKGNGKPEPATPGRAGTDAKRVDAGNTKPIETEPINTKPLLEPIETAKNAGPVSLEAAKYLEAANEPANHLRPLTFFDRRVGVSMGGGNGLREELKLAGLIEVFSVRTGRRGAPIRGIRVTERGYEFLKERRVQPMRPKGRGGDEARFWSLMIARFLVERHPECEPVIEDSRTGKAVDVGVEIDGKKIAYEITMSGEATSNVVKDLEGGYDRVEVCALTGEELIELREQAERDLKDEWEKVKDRVSFVTLKSFLP